MKKFKPSAHEVLTWEINARLVYNATVTVEATDEAGALSKFVTGQWADDGHSGAELVDWDARGNPKVLQ